MLGRLSRFLVVLSRVFLIFTVLKFLGFDGETSLEYRGFDPEHVRDQFQLPETELSVQLVGIMLAAYLVGRGNTVLAVQRTFGFWMMVAGAGLLVWLVPQAVRTSLSIGGSS